METSVEKKPRKRRTNKVNIEQLTPIEQIRLRPGMWIGSVVDPTNIFIEIIDNALDEMYSGRTDKIKIKINENNSYTVQDWGHGIELTSPKMPGADVPLELVTKLFSGGKFYDEYGFSAGMHGCGMVVVNALCEKFQLTTIYDDTHYVEYSFKNGEFISKEIINKYGDDPFSTEIYFKPSSEYFEILSVDEERIKNKIEAANCCLSPECEIYLNDELITGELITNFFSDVPENMKLSATSKNKYGETVTLTVGITDIDNGKDFRGIVNLIPTNDGTHNRTAMNIIKKNMYDIITRKKINIKVMDDILVPIKVGLVMTLKQPTFDSQTKNKLTSKPETFENMIDDCFASILTKAAKNATEEPEDKSFLPVWLRKSEDYRIQIESKKKSKERNIGKSVVVKGLFECMNKNTNECDLFLLEGESAGGSLIKCRDPNKHAVLALRGKPLNVAVKSKSAILKNDVINNICAALGYKAFGKVDPSLCRYKRIFIAADADADGSHITSLLVLLFHTLFPELIKDGKIFIVKSPLYGYTNKEGFHPIYDLSEVDKLMKSGVKLTRFKGLGEMDPDELYSTAIDPEKRQLYKVTYSDIDFELVWKDMGSLDLDN